MFFFACVYFLVPVFDCGKYGLYPELLLLLMMVVMMMMMMVMMMMMSWR